MHRTPSKFKRWFYFYKEYKYFIVLSFLLQQSDYKKLECREVLDAESVHIKNVFRRGDPMYSDALLLHFLNNWIRTCIKNN